MTSEHNQAIAAREKTIAAIATAYGKAGVGIIRISGALVTDIATTMLGKAPKPRSAVFCEFKSHTGEVLDMGLALYFKAPHSFTGEDILELHGHGGQINLERILNTVLHLGAVIAEPGEFSKRAYLNDKIDLAQAEAIAGLIESSTIAAAQGAMRSLQGDFSKVIDNIAKKILELRIYVEAAIDFPEEEIDFLADSQVSNKLEEIITSVRHLIDNAKQGCLLNDGIKVVIAGRPNVGKSTLLNCFTNAETAIVTNIPGTTRDLIKESIQINGVPVHIIDTAGLRDNAGVVEKQGILRAKQQFELADQILLIADISNKSVISPVETEIIDSYPDKTTLVINKMDLSHSSKDFKSSYPAQFICAKNNQGIDELKQHIISKAGVGSSLDDCFSARKRHIEALKATYKYCLEAKNALISLKAGELMAISLQQAHDNLGEITGKLSSDDLLGKIFATFCIGK